MNSNKIKSQNKKTALYDSHRELNAKMIAFGGFIMPISYTKGIKSEYFSVREEVGMFDVSHMGQFEIKGKNAKKFLQKVTINKVEKLDVGSGQYSAMCNNNGGIIDDFILFRKKNAYLMVVNASNINKDFQWLEKNLLEEVSLENISDKISLIAVQGPLSRKILSKIFEFNIEIPFYTFVENYYNDYSILLSRTGYTGELGYEIYGSAEVIKLIWDKLLKLNCEPVGLAARDILRMEMKYCLYGNDINDELTPLEADLSWITSMDKGSFIGLGKLNKMKLSGLGKKLIAFKMLERGVPRQGYKIYINKKLVGYVTSGTQSPILNAGIGLGYINIPYNKINQKISIAVRNQFINAIIIKPPFLNNTSLLH